MAVYLDEIYQRYQLSGGLDDCVKEIVRICREQPTFCKEAIPRTWEAAKSRVQMKLINKEWNVEYLKYFPSVDYLNFAVVFCVAMEEAGEMRAAFSVTEDVMRIWGVSVDILWHAALDNIRKEIFQLGAMDSVIESMCKDTGLDTGSIRTPSVGLGRILQASLKRTF